MNRMRFNTPVKINLIQAKIKKLQGMKYIKKIDILDAQNSDYK